MLTFANRFIQADLQLNPSLKILITGDVNGGLALKALGYSLWGYDFKSQHCQATTATVPLSEVLNPQLLRANLRRVGWKHKSGVHYCSPTIWTQNHLIRFINRNTNAYLERAHIHMNSFFSIRISQDATKKFLGGSYVYNLAIQRQMKTTLLMWMCAAALYFIHP